MEKKSTSFVTNISAAHSRTYNWQQIQQVLTESNINPAIQHNISEKLKAAYLSRFVTDQDKPVPPTVTMLTNDWRNSITSQEIINVLNQPTLEHHINKKYRNQIIQDLDLQLDGIGFLGL